MKRSGPILALLVSLALPAAAAANRRAPTLQQARHVIEAASPYAELGACHRTRDAVDCAASERWESCPENAQCSKLNFRFVIVVHWQGNQLAIFTAKETSGELNATA